MECYQVSSAAVPLLMNRAVEYEMETLGEREREREGWERGGTPNRDPHHLSKV